MNKTLEKVKNYYEYNGFLNTVKAGTKKVFPFLKNSYDSMKKYKNIDFNLSKKEKENVSLKFDKNVYIFGSVPYYDVGGGQRSSQLAKIFNKFGFKVHYIYAYDSSESKIHYMEIPAVEHKHIDNFKLDKCNSFDLFIFEAPIKKFEKFLNIAYENKAKVIYENIDNWETSLGTMFLDKDTLKEMLFKANMLVGTAELLVDQLKKYLYEYNINKEVYYLANAVDDELFEPNKKYVMPKDLVLGDKTLLYYGSLWGEWFDWELLENIAKSNENISINLIGDFNPIISKIAKLPKNIHFLGLKKQIDLPAYLNYSDFAILPFKCGDIGNYVSPLKIFEYISMNKYILATELPDIKGYPNLLYSNDYKEWLKVINSNINIDFDLRNDFIINNNWYARCSKILDVLFENNSLKCDSRFYSNCAVVVLNYNNKKVIFRNIDTLLRYKNRYEYEIIIVDNQSKDGSYEMIKQKYGDKIKLLRNAKNGCSSGRNLGVNNTSKEFILFLDSDQWILNKYFLDSYIDILLNNNSIGAVGWGAGFFNSKGYSYKTVDGYKYRYMPSLGLYRKDVGYLATCGFLMRKNLFDKIGGFDEYYDPTGYEDTDLSVNIRNTGLETVYSPYLGVGHIPHQTTKSGTDSHTKLLQEKGAYFLNKWKKINKDLIFKYVK